jgi:hypothetical protein
LPGDLRIEADLPAIGTSALLCFLKADESQSSCCCSQLGVCPRLHCHRLAIRPTLDLVGLYGTFGMQRLIFSAKYRLLVRGGCCRPKIRACAPPQRPGCTRTCRLRALLLDERHQAVAFGVCLLPGLPFLHVHCPASDTARCLMVCSGAASCCAALAAALRRGRLAAGVPAIIITMSRRPRRAGREKGHIKAAEAPRRGTSGYKDRAPCCYYEGRADELWCNQQQLRQPEGMATAVRPSRPARRQQPIFVPNSPVVFI